MLAMLARRLQRVLYSTHALIDPICREKKMANLVVCLVLWFRKFDKNLIKA